jgi:hypothetical protein
LEQAIVTWVGEQVRHPSKIEEDCDVLLIKGVEQVSAYKRLSGGCRLVDAIPRRYVCDIWVTGHISSSNAHTFSSCDLDTTVHPGRYCAVLSATNDDWISRMWNWKPPSVGITPDRHSEVAMSEAQGGLESGKSLSPGFTWDLPRQSLRPRNRHPVP